MEMWLREGVLLSLGGREVLTGRASRWLALTPMRLPLVDVRLLPSLPNMAARWVAHNR